MENNLNVEIVERDPKSFAFHPSNPRDHSDESVARLAESIQEDPLYFRGRPILLSDRTGELVVIGGEGRTRAAILLGLDSVPSVVFHGLTEEDEVRIMQKDNSHSGKWNDAKLSDLARKWGDAEMKAWSPDVKWENPADMVLKSNKDEGDQDYKDFVEKFETKLTTDDCYTPKAVYEAVLDFVDKNVVSLKGRKVLRPFYPGGDYEKENYPDGCIVVDNPPFSIFTKIVRFYQERGIPFFLFSPALTGFVARELPGLTYIVVGAPVTYENGAIVRTSFITNQRPGIRVWVCHGLFDAIDAAQPEEDKRPPKFIMPKEVITQARIMKLADTFDFELKDEEILDICSYLIDKESGNRVDLYGGGYIIADYKADELKERERERERELERERER